MTPTPSQIHQALKNHKCPGRTPAARIMDAIHQARSARWIIANDIKRR